MYDGCYPFIVLLMGQFFFFLLVFRHQMANSSQSPGVIIRQCSLWCTRPFIGRHIHPFTVSAIPDTTVVLLRAFVKVIRRCDTRCSIAKRTARLGPRLDLCDGFLWRQRSFRWILDSILLGRVWLFDHIRLCIRINAFGLHCVWNTFDFPCGCNTFFYWPGFCRLSWCFLLEFSTCLRSHVLSECFYLPEKRHFTFTPFAKNFPFYLLVLIRKPPFYIKPTRASFLSFLIPPILCTDIPEYFFLSLFYPALLAPK